MANLRGIFFLLERGGTRHSFKKAKEAMLSYLSNVLSFRSSDRVGQQLSLLVPSIERPKGVGDAEGGGGFGRGG
jgi:hypothetical protein